MVTLDPRHDPPINNDRQPRAVRLCYRRRFHLAACFWASFKQGLSLSLSLSSFASLCVCMKLPMIIIFVKILRLSYKSKVCCVHLDVRCRDCYADLLYSFSRSELLLLRFPLENLKIGHDFTRTCGVDPERIRPPLMPSDTAFFNPPSSASPLIWLNNFFFGIIIRWTTCSSHWHVFARKSEVVRFYPVFCKIVYCSKRHECGRDSRIILVFYFMLNITLCWPLLQNLGFLAVPMRGRSYTPSPPRGYGRRGRSPSPRGRYGGRGRDLPTSLLVRNLRHDCRYGFVSVHTSISMQLPLICEVDTCEVSQHLSCYLV